MREPPRANGWRKGRRGARAFSTFRRLGIRAQLQKVTPNALKSLARPQKTRSSWRSGDTARSARGSRKANLAAARRRDMIGACA
jgi:hypothetical protein